jgi:hypothetical protein
VSLLDRHTVRVELPVEELKDALLKGHVYDDQGSVKGLLYAAEAQDIYRRFERDTKRPHWLLIRAKNRPAFQEGGKVFHGDRVFTILGVSGPNEGTATGIDNVQIGLEELDA